MIRPYTRCQKCGLQFPAPQSNSSCQECKDGQAHFWPVPYAPEEFVPIAGSG